MKLQQFMMELSTQVDINTGLKATTLANILAVENLSGLLLGIYCTDPDDLTQSERLQITIDDDVVLNDVAYDIPNTDDFIHLLASIAKGSVLSGTATGADVGIMLDARIGIPFHHALLVHYLRAVAGTTGLTINIVYAIRPDRVHVPY